MATHEIGNGCGLSTEAVLASNHKRRRALSDCQLQSRSRGTGFQITIGGTLT